MDAHARPARAYLVGIALLASCAGMAGASQEPASTAPVCEDHYHADFRPVSRPQPEARAAMARPAHGTATGEATAGTCLVRITDRTTQPVGGFVRNVYSRIQAFNADDSLVLVIDGSDTLHLHDARTFGHVRALDIVGGADGEAQWHPDDPRRIRYFPPGNRAVLAELDLDSGQSDTLADFSGGRLRWDGVGQVRTRWEGSPSADGRHWCLMAYDRGGGFLGVFSYDLHEDTVPGMRSMDHAPDHVGTSPSGRHCVVSHTREHGGTVAWNAAFTMSRRLHDASEHSDLAIGPGGEDYYVFVDYDTDGMLVALDIDSGARLPLLDTYLEGSTTAYHVSARNFSHPGWVLVSTYAGTPPRQWLHDKVMAVELAADPRIMLLADHRSRFGGYWTAPMATVNRDFTRVLFGSNWGTGAAQDMEAYMIVLPEGFLDTLRR